MQQNNVTQVYWKDLPELMSPQGKPSQSLKNFDSEFIDIVDYIIRITHRIWEQKNIALCNDYYAEYCPVHTLGGYSDDVATVIKNTLFKCLLWHSIFIKFISTYSLLKRIESFQ